MLVGTEVKSLREAGLAGRLFCHRRRRRGSQQPAHPGVSPRHLDQPRTAAQSPLLLHRRQIDTLIGKIRDGNLTLVLSLYHRRKGEGGERRWPAASSGPRQAPGPGPPGTPSVRWSANWGRRAKGHVLIGSSALASARWRTGSARLCRRHRPRRVAALRGCFGVPSGRDGARPVIGRRRRHRSAAGDPVGARCGGVSQAFGVVVLRIELGAARSRWCHHRPRCWWRRCRWEPGWRWGWPGPSPRSAPAGAGGDRPAGRPPTRIVRPHRFTTKVAWLTVGSGLAFGLNLCHGPSGAGGGLAVAVVLSPGSPRRWWWCWWRSSAISLCRKGFALSWPPRSRHGGQCRDVLAPAGPDAAAGGC